MQGLLENEGVDDEDEVESRRKSKMPKKTKRNRDLNGSTADQQERSFG